MGSVSSLTNRVLARLSRETSSGRFIPEMDGLRFAAIGMVFLFHLNGYLTVKSQLYYPAAPSGWLAQAALVGFRGVELFFVISGFILGLPFAAHYLKGNPPVDLKKYYLRRLTRLEPPYFIATIAFFFLALWVKQANAGMLWPHLAASLSYLHDLVYAVPSPVIGVAWSLEIEVQFYLLVPVLTLLFAIRNTIARRTSLVMLIGFILAAQALFLHGNPRISLSILGYLQFFLIGFLLADIFIVDWQEVPGRSLYWDLVALVGWPLLFLTLRLPLLTHWVFPAVILVLYCATFRSLLANRFFVNRWITAIGGMCYSIYLIHYEVISATGRFTKRISEGLPYWEHLLVQIVLVGAAVLFVCGLYFVFLEKPCMRRDWPQRLWNSVQRLLTTGERPVETEAAD
jgi:peptidoglycan/LPS O-acetylase OafA/YrhL